MANVPALGATNARARPRLCRRAGRRGPRLASRSLAMVGRVEYRSGTRAGAKALGMLKGVELSRRWVAWPRPERDGRCESALHRPYRATRTVGGVLRECRKWIVEQSDLMKSCLILPRLGSTRLALSPPVVVVFSFALVQ